MVTVKIRDNLFKILDQINTPFAPGADTAWFAEDITIQTSTDSRGTTIVVDFSYTTTTVIFYTLNGVDVEFADGKSITGGQSRYIRVTNGDVINFKATAAGTLNRCIVGEV